MNYTRTIFSRLAKHGEVTKVTMPVEESDNFTPPKSLDDRVTECEAQSDRALDLARNAAYPVAALLVMFGGFALLAWLTAWKDGYGWRYWHIGVFGAAVFARGIYIFKKAL